MDSMNPTQSPRSEKTPAAIGKDRDGSASGLTTEVIWHDLECGSYRADLPLWRELAGTVPGPVLDVGAGTGRVTLDLAQNGPQVSSPDPALRNRGITALDISPMLLTALRERAVGLEVETVCADARSFELSRRDFALCLLPMQTLQLLNDASERIAFLRCALAHLRPGGLLACAIVTELDTFNIADGSPGPTPETSLVGETLYISQAESVRVFPRRVVIERSRRIVSPAACGDPSNQSAAEWVTNEPAAERNVIELARVSPAELEQEASQVGFHPEPAREIEPTDEHVGSAVVMLRA
jgi:SAM-dependent methyltransferase